MDSYVQRCLNGAESRGEQFRRDFLSTTLLNTGETLAEYVGEDPDS